MKNFAQGFALGAFIGLLAIVCIFIYYNINEENTSEVIEIEMMQSDAIPQIKNIDVNTKELEKFFNLLRHNDVKSWRFGIYEDGYFMYITLKNNYDFTFYKLKTIEDIFNSIDVVFKTIEAIKGVE